MPIILVIKSEEKKQKVKLTSKPFVFGRSSKSDLKLDDTKVSGKHLSVGLTGEGKVIVKDLDTTNGTFLNGTKILESYMFLEDELTIGDIRMALSSEDMSSKEEKLLTRPGEKTSMTYVNLSNHNPDIPKLAAKNNPEPEAKPTGGTSTNTNTISDDNFKNPEARQSEIRKLLEKDDPPKEEEIEEKTSDSSSPGRKTRMIQRAQMLSGNKGSASQSHIDEVRDGENFELEESSGATKMLKISKGKGLSKRGGLGKSSKIAKKK